VDLRRDRHATNRRSARSTLYEITRHRIDRRIICPFSLGQEPLNFELALERAEEEAPYRYEIAEGRMYSRTVIITLKKKGRG
jgi:hypothetical protein